MIEEAKIKYCWGVQQMEHFIPDNIPKECIDSASQFIVAMQSIKDIDSQYFKFQLALNMFYWHLRQFEGNQNPIPEFLNLIETACVAIKSFKKKNPEKK